MHGDGANHYEGEAGIPVTKDVEEANDLGRIGHARNDKSGAEDETREERHELRPHGSPPRLRTTATVTVPVAMKVAVATSDRLDKRLRPQTP